jgi:hypothetical protein
VSNLRDQYDAMIYKVSPTYRCPNGEPYETCTHWDIKQQYDRERSAKWNEYSRRSAALQARRQSYESSEKELLVIQKAVAADLQKLSDDNRRFENDKAEFSKFMRKMDGWRRSKARADAAIIRERATLQALIK